MVTAERLDVAPVERNSVKSEIFLEGHRSAASIIVGLVLVLVLLRISVSVGIGVNLSGRSRLNDTSRGHGLSRYNSLNRNCSLCQRNHRSGLVVGGNDLLRLGCRSDSRFLCHDATLR